MSALTLVSPTDRPLRALVEAALENELRLLHAGMLRTEERLQGFGSRYGLASSEFLQQHENDELAEDLDTAEWVGEMRLHTRLREKADTLQEIQIAN